ncbi:hypothetical protein TWF132_007885 [Orbilia oligospora]|nr:hypothetical protein TWF132_007885 [Orbilia oligospora]
MGTKTPANRVLGLISGRKVYLVCLRTGRKKKIEAASKLKQCQARHPNFLALGISKHGSSSPVDQYLRSRHRATNNRILAVPAGPKSQLELTSQAPPQLYQTVRHYRLMTVYHIELLAASSWQIRPRKHRSTREA